MQNLLLNEPVLGSLLAAAVGSAVMLDTTEVVGVVSTGVGELVGSTIVELDSVPLLSGVLGLGLAAVLVLRLGILGDVTAEVGPPSPLTPTKRAAVARSRHSQRHSNALAWGALGSNMAAG